MYRLLLRCRKSGNKLQSVRADKDRITKLYQSSQARVKDYQGTIRRIESEISAGDSAIGNATDSVGRVEAILGRMETAIGGLKKTDP